MLMMSANPHGLMDSWDSFYKKITPPFLTYYSFTGLSVGAAGRADGYGPYKITSVGIPICKTVHKHKQIAVTYFGA